MRHPKLQKKNFILARYLLIFKKKFVQHHRAHKYSNLKTNTLTLLLKASTHLLVLKITKSYLKKIQLQK